MPSLLDEARDASRGDTRGVVCEMGAWLATLPDDDQADVNEALAAPWEGPGRVRHTVLLDLLNERYGTEFTINQIQHHRRRKCRCDW